MENAAADIALIPRNRQLAFPHGGPGMAPHPWERQPARSTTSEYAGGYIDMRVGNVLYSADPDDIAHRSN